MKKVIIYLAIGLTVLSSAIIYSEKIHADLAGNILRLHIVANSDSESDQALKLKVRDRVLNVSGNLFENTTGLADAEQTAKERLPEIIAAAQDEVYKNGYDYTVSAEVGEQDFPLKKYGNITLPQGAYNAVKIKIGGAEGKNWWCVMFPPLCFVDTSVVGVDSDALKVLKDNLSGESYDLITASEFDIRFKVVDVVQGTIQTIKTALK